MIRVFVILMWTPEVPCQQFSAPEALTNCLVVSKTSIVIDAECEVTHANIAGSYDDEGFEDDIHKTLERQNIASADSNFGAGVEQRAVYDDDSDRFDAALIEGISRF